MTKLILKTAAVTFSLLVAVALILFGAVSLASPAAMMTFTESLGMEGLSAYYSVAVCDRSGEIGDIAAAVERSYNAGHYADAAVYGEKLLASDEFSAYCTLRDDDTEGSGSIRSSYAQYAAGITSSALYYEGEEEKAIDTAMLRLRETKSFPENNAMIYLAASAMEREDIAFCEKIVNTLNNLAVEDAQEQEDLRTFLSDLQTYCGLN